MLTVLKFFTNADERKREETPIISRTLCKITMIAPDYKGVMPKDGEWWWVQIVQETFSKGSLNNGLSGVFVVEPIKPVDTKILRLIPGMFTCRLEENVLIIRPNQDISFPWIMPKQLKDQLRKKHKALSVIVDLTPSDYSEVLKMIETARGTTAVQDE